MSEEDASYEITGSSLDNKFKNRVDSIFGSLVSLEKKHTETRHLYKNDMQESVQDGEEERRHETSHGNTGFRGGSNQRGKRRLPKRVPDHVINPKDWTKYSLKDDGSRDVSKGLSADQLNKKIALDFMEDLKRRKLNDVDLHGIEIDHDSKVTFRKPEVLKDNDETSNISLYGSSHGAKARVMKTFEFGEKSNMKKDKVVDNNSEEQNSTGLSINLEVDEENSVKDNDKLVSKTEEDNKTEGFVTRKKNKKILIRKRVTDDIDDTND